ncbi:50S ribosome-binding protein YggL [Cupriavidus sp. H18C2]|uniref:50S ribosome-binding protein YggL n=1 Tax=Cupriavidus sp. H18C2 TaxID=3241602 RepID=UPI003BF7C1B9
MSDRVSYFSEDWITSKGRNLRQRKKLRVTEFQEPGFHVTAQLAEGLDAEARVAACDAFIRDGTKRTG